MSDFLDAPPALQTPAPDPHADATKLLRSNNLYEILGVKETVTPEELKSKYRKAI